MKRSSASAASALLVMSAGLVAVTAAPAQADCSYHWENRDPTGGHVDWQDPQPRLHSGPHSSCRTIYWLPGGTTLAYHCYTINSYGNTWTHVRTIGTDQYGWIYDGYLPDNGSRYRC